MNYQKIIEELEQIKLSQFVSKDLGYNDGINRAIQIVRKHADGWISVDDRLPEQLEEVLIYTTHTCSQIVAVYDNGRFCTVGTISNVTHWKPIYKPNQEV